MSVSVIEASYGNNDIDTVAKNESDIKPVGGVGGSGSGSVGGGELVCRPLAALRAACNSCKKLQILFVRRQHCTHTIHFA